jgi:DNA-binding NtrC family response regulator/pSer/pThr/pTyr-binding forkhead associated (FHA) protein
VGDERRDRTTIEREALRPSLQATGAGPRATLVIYAHDDTRVVELQEGREVFVGRAEPADVIVDDLTISRRHARFAYQDGHVVVEDLGSRNGTWVRGLRVNDAHAGNGDDVRLGGVAVSVHVRASREPPLGLGSYDQLVARVEDELVAARAGARPLSVIAVFAPEQDAAMHAESRHVSRWAPQLAAELREMDALAVHGPYSVLVLLPDASVSYAERVARRLVAVHGALDLYAGVASFPETAKSAEGLVSAAHTAARSGTRRMPVQQARSASPGEEGSPLVLAESMLRVVALAERVAASDVPVLILGETGAGKEVIARHVHSASARSHKRMVVVNCAALAPTLLEAALFGHEKGAFTGADTARKGVFEEGDGSTVFLDEIGELPAAAQAALLRVLETRRFSRVGSAKELEVDVRIVAATHRDLEALVEARAFRADLFYRLNTLTLKIPPLRERRDEIPALARRFLDQTVERWNTSARAFAPPTLELLSAYEWPGNVRELRNVIERAAVICTGRTLEPADLPERVRTLVAEDVEAHSVFPSQPPTAGTCGDLQAASFRDRIRDYELKLITDALTAADGNQSRAAEILQIPLRTLVHKIKTFGLKKSYRRDA